MSIIWKHYQVFHHQCAGTEIHNRCACACFCSAFCSPAMILLHSTWACEKLCVLYTVYQKIQRICIPPSLLCLVALWADSCYISEKNPCKPHLLPRQLLLHVATWKMWSSLRVAWVFIVDVWRLPPPSCSTVFAMTTIESVAAHACKWHGPCLEMSCWWVC